MAAPSQGRVALNATAPLATASRVNQPCFRIERPLRVVADTDSGLSWRILGARRRLAAGPLRLGRRHQSGCTRRPIGQCSRSRRPPRSCARRAQTTGCADQASSVDRLSDCLVLPVPLCSVTVFGYWAWLLGTQIAGSMAVFLHVVTAMQGNNRWVPSFADT